MKAIEVDAVARSAQAQGGVLWGELDRATQAFGLAVPGGTDSEVGIAGLTLGGGNGWLMPTCDNLLSADVVMARIDGTTAPISSLHGSALSGSAAAPVSKAADPGRRGAREHDAAPEQAVLPCPQALPRPIARFAE